MSIGAKLIRVQLEGIVVRRTVVFLALAFLLVAAGGVAAGKTYVEQNGLIVIEAENFDTNTKSDTHEWKIEASTAGFSGKGSLIALPNANVNQNPFSGLKPVATYKIKINKAGTYHTIYRATSLPDDPGSNDSAWITVDDQQPDARTYCDAQQSGWAWCFGDNGAPVSFTLTAGEHLLKLWVREDGTLVDQVGLTMDGSFARPDGKPLAESRAM